MAAHELSSGKEWAQLGNILEDEKDSLSGTGFSIASSDDGKIVAIGSPYKKNNIGSVTVYEYVEEKLEWVILGRDISGLNHGDFFGFDVALSYDGDILVITSPRALSGRGTVGVYRYDRVVDEWEKIGDDIEGEKEREEFGYSVAVSKNGDYIAVGAPLPSNSAGSVRVFQYSGGDDFPEWKKVGSDIVGQSNEDESGHAVDILLNDGELFVAIGAPMDLYTRGTARVMKYNPLVASWNQLGPFVDGDETGTDLGRSVSLGHDGDNLILAVGFPGPGVDKFSEIKSGVQSYSIDSNGKWDFYGQMIFPVEKDDDTGYKVSLSHDAQTLAIGSPQYGQGNGLVRVYHRDVESMKYEQVGIDLIGEEFDELGFSVVMARNGKAITVGSPEGGYVVTYIIHGSLLDINSRSALSIVMVTFLSVGLIALFTFVGYRAYNYVKLRGILFTSLPGNSADSEHQMVSFPVQNTRNVPMNSHHDSDDDEASEGSDVSYEENDIDYETHLREIA